ncbi:MAG: enoyl-CoA hydratase/isomerase family protein [Lachnospiraceae bacterium]|nr:enoyl-CoA hydratase/isomerase family protein [Lachnospiraceae bacterium]
MAFIKYEVNENVGVITIDRPKALNALNTDVLAELSAVLDGVDLDTVRALIITGSGDKSFVAGADIAEMSTKTLEEGVAFYRAGNAVMRKVETFPLPVIAAVNGFALGGGNELAMSCDIRICSENAVFGQPEVGLGITPGFGGTQRLARIVSPGIAKQFIYTATNFKADKALAIGLVNAVYPQEQLMDEAMKLAKKIAAQAPIAVRACKKCINDGLDKAMDDAIEVECVVGGACFGSEDQKEGMANFLRKKDDPLKVKQVAFKNA